MKRIVILLVFALLFIPKMGAVGAALCNGCSQVAGILLTRMMVRKVIPIRFPVADILRSAATSTVMGLTVYAVVRSLPPVPGLIAGVLTGIVVFVPLTRMFGYVRGRDQERFVKIASKLPAPARRAVLPVLEFMTAPAR